MRVNQNLAKLSVVWVRAFKKIVCPVLGQRKFLKNFNLKGRQIIRLPQAPKALTSLRPTLPVNIHRNRVLGSAGKILV